MTHGWEVTEDFVHSRVELAEHRLTADDQHRTILSARTRLCINSPSLPHRLRRGGPRVEQLNEHLELFLVHREEVHGNEAIRRRQLARRVEESAHSQREIGLLETERQ